MLLLLACRRCRVESCGYNGSRVVAKTHRGLVPCCCQERVFMGGGHRESQGDSWLLVLSEAGGSLGPGLALVSVAVCTFVLPELSRVALTQALQRASALACATALLS